MNDDIIQQAAEVLAGHVRSIWNYDDGTWHCSCVPLMEIGPANLFHDADTHAAHVARALADAGLLPTETEWGVSRRCAPDCPAGPEHIDSEDFGGYESSARRFVASDPESLTLKSRNVCPWKDVS